jgi:hypothetical protein
MFIDQYSIVTLEYHYYQNNCTYSTLDPLNEHYNEQDKLCDSDGEELDHKLGT